ncbi:hypothetical protein GCM10022257_03190 [Hyunsoonleella aestuarii]|uniref:Uncharacterized protein n=1 Tax=Hyunsoonleella aestuarii TaxID=912802 RepID=A0ABP8E834_9FLAO
MRLAIALLSNSHLALYSLTIEILGTDQNNIKGEFVVILAFMARLLKDYSTNLLCIN